MRMGKPILNLVAATSLLFAPELAVAAPPTADRSWFSTYFFYARPDKVIVEETTPTKAQLSFHNRPPVLGRADLKLTDSKQAEPVKIGDVDIRRLRFKDADGDIVTAMLCTPAKLAGPWPLAIAVHGLNSNKAQVCGQVAPSLVKRGFAVLAPDMPAHGERPGNWRDLMEKKDWMTALLLHRRAIVDIRQCIDIAERRNDLDTSKGVVLAGYSMGSWLDSIAGPIDQRVKAMVLMVGGATDAAPFLRMLPQLATADPLQVLPLFAGRPLLMLNGEHDPVVTPEMAERLFDAAPQPKQQKWYDSGHHLPDSAYDDAATWIADTWKTLTSP